MNPTDVTKLKTEFREMYTDIFKLSERMQSLSDRVPRGVLRRQVTMADLNLVNAANCMSNLMKAEFDE